MTNEIKWAQGKPNAKQLISGSPAQRLSTALKSVFAHPTTFQMPQQRKEIFVEQLTTQ